MLLLVATLLITVAGLAAIAAAEPRAQIDSLVWDDERERRLLRCDHSGTAGW